MSYRGAKGGTLDSKPTLESVSSAIRRHRESGGKRIPTLLWQQVVALKSEHSLSKLSEATGFSVEYLRKKLSKRRASFVEVKMPEPISIPPSEPVLVELRRPDGTEIRVRLSSQHSATLLGGLLR
jgi:hypothetical protein